MPCDTNRQPQETPEQRQRSITAALRRLEGALDANQVTLVVGPNGAVVFRNWNPATRDGVTDVCAFRRLSSAGSLALRKALARAEAAAGRRVDANVVAAGVHSHDGGGSWAAGH